MSEKFTIITSCRSAEEQEFIGKAIMTAKKEWNNKQKKKDTPVAELDLPVRITMILESAGIDSVEALVKKTEKDLLKLPRFGESSLQYVVSALKQRKLRLFQ